MNPYQVTGPVQICVSGGRISGHILWNTLINAAIKTVSL